MRYALAVFAVLAGALIAPGSARATEQTLVFTSERFAVEGYGVKQGVTLVPSPSVDGYVVGMEADIVDANGRVQGEDEVMLHHVVFVKAFARDLTCPALAGERFWGKGEHDVAGVLPPGYGYANKATDRWGLVYMLMNHKKRPLTARVRYRVRYVTGEQLTPVRPVWLDVRNCRNDPVFDVPGTGRRGSTYTERAEFVMPESGRFVAGGGHLHGGGVSVGVESVTCGRTLFTSLPTWGGPEPKPLLHEAGPAKMSSFSSTVGIPVSGGEKLSLAAVYDNARPHTRAMGIMILLFAPGPVSACESVPALAVDLGRPAPPPAFRMPLPRQPRGPLHRDVTRTWVGDFRFGHERISIARGTVFTWRFVGLVEHDVTLVNGPVGFSSPALRNASFSRRFTRPGKYELFCSLHPVKMSQTILVR